MTYVHREAIPEMSPWGKLAFLGDRRIRLHDESASEASVAVPCGIETEAAWRDLAPGPAIHSLQIARWRSVAASSEPAHACSKDCYTIEINLQRTQMRLSVDGQSLHDGPLAAGAVQMTAPGRCATASFGASVDMLHLFVPTWLIETVSGGLLSREPKLGAAPRVDTIVERLGWSMLNADELPASAAGLYRDGLSAAIVARIMTREFGADRERPAPASGLVKWRLNKVVRFVEENLDQQIKLANLADSAGLSRMHFAAQFRAATGLRPHDYVVRRRIERAQELLRATTMPLVEVGLSVGFQTQAHFTTVFRALVAETPGRWRQSCGG